MSLLLGKSVSESAYTHVHTHTHTHKHTHCKHAHTHPHTHTHSESYICTYVSGLLHALVAMSPPSVDQSSGTTEQETDNEEALPVTSLICKWKVPIFGCIT